MEQAKIPSSSSVVKQDSRSSLFNKKVADAISLVEEDLVGYPYEYDEDMDTASTVHGAASDMGGDDHNHHHHSSSSPVVIAKGESKRVFYTRALVLLVLVGVAASVSAVVFLYARNVEEENFETYFQDVADKLVSEFIGGANRRLTAIESFANDLTSYALDQKRQQNSTDSVWPNVVLPDFARRARYTIELSDVLSIIFFPIVKDNATKASWEEFSVENQGWFQEGLDLQEHVSGEEEYDQKWTSILESIREPTEDGGIPPEVFRLTAAGSERETGPGPYAPWWQFEPVFPASVIVNYNAFSHPERVAPLQSVLDNQHALLTEAFDYSQTNDTATLGKRAVLNLFLHHGHDEDKFRKEYEAGPVSDIYVPVFEDYNNPGNNREVVGEITAYVYWQVYFENVLSGGQRDVGIYVVLENSCDQSFTYRVDGSDATYLGQGDGFHNAEAYDHLAVFTEYGSFVQFEQGQQDIEDLPEGQCLYRLRVYPSDELRNVFTTNGPMRFSLILAGTFTFTCLVFLLYDFLVERRQRVVMDTAVKSSAVVASLFPEEVRDRLYGNNQNNKDVGNSSKQHQGNSKNHNKDHHSDSNNNSKDNLDFVGGNASSTSAFDGNNTPSTSEEQHDQYHDGEGGGDVDPMAIADLYPNCTVLFCDIVGFTRWSSGREPVEVFKLLETIFKTFDKVATRLGVFKVETIGDCYVAVTGLPHPQDDHAVIMAKFAAECTAKFHRVTHRLADQLGRPETAGLKVRVGMNSGPVTAGVLRGAKARFQLFGDTVNTAARMESTGIPMKIQVSSSTAEAIKQGGHADWVRERIGQVNAKGKGKMQTYWLEPRHMMANSTTTTASTTTATTTTTTTLGSSSAGETPSV